jgi:hypothetical protein
VTHSLPLLESNDFATLGAAYEATDQLTPALSAKHLRDSFGSGSSSIGP